MTNNSINSNIPIGVSQGGTGAITLAQHSPLIGKGTAAIGTITPGANGEVLIAQTGADPAFASLTSPNSTIVFTPGAGTLSMDMVNATAKTTSFVPSLSFGGGTTDITYSVARYCYYMRLGNVVVGTINFTLTSKGTDVGAAAVTLPINTATGMFSVNIVNMNNITFSGRYIAYASGGYVYLYDSSSGSAATAITDVNFSDTSICYFSFIYLV